MTTAILDREGSAGSLPNVFALGDFAYLRPTCGFFAAGSSPIGGGRRRTVLVAFLAVIVGVGLVGDGAWIHAKAWLAQLLLERSWAAAQATGSSPPPWPWADTRPIARLTAPRQDVDLFVLAGASGRTLAFGPGHHDGSAAPGTRGNVVLSGHRDTHFRFLREVATGDVLTLETAAGARTRYRIRRLDIVDSRHLAFARRPSERVLTLVTCYPFDALTPGGPLRYVVTAVADH